MECKENAEQERWRAKRIQSKKDGVQREYRITLQTSLGNVKLWADFQSLPQNQIRIAIICSLKFFELALLQKLCVHPSCKWRWYRDWYKDKPNMYNVHPSCPMSTMANLWRGLHTINTRLRGPTQTGSLCIYDNNKFPSKIATTNL